MDQILSKSKQSLSTQSIKNLNKQKSMPKLMKNSTINRSNINIKSNIISQNLIQEKKIKLSNNSSNINLIKSAHTIKETKNELGKLKIPSFICEDKDPKSPSTNRLIEIDHFKIKFLKDKEIKVNLDFSNDFINLKFIQNTSQENNYNLNTKILRKELFMKKEDKSSLVKSKKCSSILDESKYESKVINPKEKIEKLEINKNVNTTSIEFIKSHNENVKKFFSSNSSPISDLKKYVTNYADSFKEVLDIMPSKSSKDYILNSPKNTQKLMDLIKMPLNINKSSSSTNLINKHKIDEFSKKYLANKFTIDLDSKLLDTNKNKRPPKIFNYDILSNSNLLDSSNYFTSIVEKENKISLKDPINNNSYNKDSDEEKNNIKKSLKKDSDFENKKNNKLNKEKIKVLSFEKRNENIDSNKIKNYKTINPRNQKKNEIPKKALTVKKDPEKLIFNISKECLDYFSNKEKEKEKILRDIIIKELHEKPVNYENNVKENSLNPSKKMTNANHEFNLKNDGEIILVNSLNPSKKMTEFNLKNNGEIILVNSLNPSKKKTNDKFNQKNNGEIILVNSLNPSKKKTNDKFNQKNDCEIILKQESNHHQILEIISKRAISSHKKKNSNLQKKSPITKNNTIINIKDKTLIEKSNLFIKKNSNENIDKGLEILNISNSSNMPKDDLKYFEKKAKKISQYIKECNNYLIFLDHDKLNEYPSTIINFYKIGRVRN